MTTVIVTHEVEDGDRWLRVWNRKPGNRYGLLTSIGTTARVFRSQINPNLTGLIFEASDLAKFNALLQSDESKKAMKEDGVNIDTLHIFYELNEVLEIGLSEHFQIELEKSSNSLQELTKEKSMGQYGEKHDIFGSFVIMTINQMAMLNKRTFPKMLCNTDRAVESSWSLIKRSFAVNIVTLTAQFLEINSEPDTNSEKNSALQAIDHIMNCEIINHNDYIDSLKWIKRKISNERGSYLIRSIKQLLISKNIGKNNRSNYIGFFQALNALRNNYAHLSLRASSDETNEIRNYLPFLIKNGQEKSLIDTYPNDIYEIVKLYYAFLDAIENKNSL